MLSEGWNHVALLWFPSIAASGLTLGRARGEYMAGLLDEVAVYRSRPLFSDIASHYYLGRRELAGKARFQVRGVG